ncbi:MAG TPA: AfsR/SARP family transcriptional regulator, partial [Ilumatobacteraceae bacterium]|nr:AfsR/SARP family transcriptional regulator [Ilumatobacteraceae bacterium]
MEVALLGELRVTHEDSIVELTSDRHRTIVAMLAMAVPTGVAADRLIDVLWADDLPDKPSTALQIQISRLRKALPDGVIDTTDNGYRLAIDPDAIDVHRFRRLVAEARRSDAPEAAAQAYSAALELWRGSPLASVRSQEWAEAEVAELEELHSAAVEARHRTLLDESSGGDQIADLERAVAEHPYRENLTELLMLALYRAGRQSDALHRFDELRRRLGDELGLEPSPQLRDLELAILTHSDELAPASTSGPAVDGAAPPLALTTFVGRSREIEQLVERSAQHRLVTVVGPGGVGKTRLAVEVVRNHGSNMAHGAVVVEL